MINISTKDIRDALRSADEDGYVLFKEIRDEENIKKVKKHTITRKMYDELLQYANSIKDEALQELPFGLFVQYLENGNRYNYERIYFNLN